MLERIGITCLVGVILLASACGPSEDSLLQTVSAEWTGEDNRGGMRIRVDRDGGVLIGLGPDGSVLDSMAVELIHADPDAGTVRLRRVETGGEFTVERLRPGSDDRSRIRLVFPNGRQVRLVFLRPLPSGDGR